jgi:two-component sensor histidine kinase
VDVLLRRLIGQRLGSDHSVLLDLEEVTLSVRKATSLALIINELLTFIVEHGVRLDAIELRESEQEVLLNMRFGDLINPADQEETSTLMIETLIRHDLCGTIQYHQNIPLIQIQFPKNA